jgi:hypothetical protein
MKRIYLALLCFICFQLACSQEITNFYLEPGSTNDEVILNTSFYNSNLAGFIESSYTVDGNVINFSICYALSSATQPIFDDRQFILNLPSGYPNFILNVDLFFYDHNTEECIYDTSEDSGVFIFDYPYVAAAKTFVPDDTFEAYFELNGLGDDIPNNDYVFTHKVINLSNLDLDYSNISGLGPRIADLTGIEILYRLKDIKCDDNKIVEFDGVPHPRLEYLKVFNDHLESVNLSQNPNLWRLEIGSENLTDLDLSANTNLEILSVGGVPNLSQLDLSNQIELYSLGIYGTGITNLDLTSNVLLRSFSCTNNTSLTTLIAGNAPNLTQFNCADNALEILDVSEFWSLTQLIASGNNLTHLDVSQNLNVEHIFVQNNNLISINLRNGFSQNILLLLATNNPDLFCVEVDDETAAPYGNTWIFDHPLIYSENCTLGTNDLDMVEAVIYPNPVQNILTIESKEYIISTEVYSILGELLASEKGKSQVDFSTYGKGIYFLKIDTENGAVFQKVLKE